jgi:hypothetical protein
MLDTSQQIDWPLPAADATFVNALENIFVAIRGRGVQWSADDRARAERWHQIGVSLPRVVSVIEMRAKSWRFVHGDTANLPIRLQYYEKAVLGGPAMALRVAPAGGDGVQPASANTAPTQFDPAHPNRVSANAAKRGADSSEPTLADRLYTLLDRVPDLVAGTDDLALQLAYKQAGLSLGRSLLGKTRDCEAGIGTAGFEGAIERAHKVVRKTVLSGIGPSECATMTDPIDSKLAKEKISATARKRRRNKLLDKVLSAQLNVAFPGAHGWQGA